MLPSPQDGLKNIFIKPDGERGKGRREGGRREGERSVYVPGANKGEGREKRNQAWKIKENVVRDIKPVKLAANSNKSKGEIVFSLTNALISCS